MLKMMMVFKILNYEDGDCLFWVETDVPNIEF